MNAVSVLKGASIVQWQLRQMSCRTSGCQTTPEVHYSFSGAKLCRALGMRYPDIE